jgi:hypothetical protein
MAEKGLNRGGANGQQAESGDEQGNLAKPGWREEQGNLKERKGDPGRTGQNEGAQRGGLQREPNLTGREEETGHEVD